jgi:Alpha/beta hydrolase domain
MRPTVLVILALALGIFSGPAAMARVDRVEVQSREPFHLARVGQYVQIRGTFIGSLDPGEEPIPNLDEAPRRADGRVEYRSDFVIVAPDSPTSGNRFLLFDVENNGRPVVHGLYNSPLDGLVRMLEVGNGFVEDEGYTIAVASWQDGHGIELPAYAGADGKPVPLLAVGFAAVRDFAAFLRFEAKDGAGNPNPVAGTLDYALAAGSSQTSRVLKSFVYHGFNRVGTRLVFDGIHLHIGQSGTMPYIPPAGADPEVVRLTLVGDQSVFPFTFQDVLAPLAERGEKPPRILATNVAGDYYRRRLSLLRTGPEGSLEDVALPDSVRIWDIAGASHGIIYRDDCDLPRANVDWHPLLRAALVRLTRWVREGTPPPPTRLIPLEPSEPLPYLNPPPSDQPRAKLLVPRRDDDGNAVGGVRLPAVAVPLGTFGGWNAPLENDCGDQSNFYYPFARTRWQRLMTSDGRPSLEERYGTADAYLEKFRAAATDLVSEGYLLEEDARGLIERSAKARESFPSSRPSGP